jgi:hypothetical protein
MRWSLIRQDEKFNEKQMKSRGTSQRYYSPWLLLLQGGRSSHSPVQRQKNGRLAGFLRRQENENNKISLFIFFGIILFSPVECLGNYENFKGYY